MSISVGTYSVFSINNASQLRLLIFCRKYGSKAVSSKLWRGVVGLEVHAQINTSSKLFSGASTKYGAAPNSNVSVFDAAIPGTLPQLNRACVEAGVLTALALSCTVHPVCLFDRKHYFYSDLPAGYQITQQRSPLASHGVLEFQVYRPGYHKNPYVKKSVLKQIQLEQDSGKSIHDDVAKQSLVDLNRAGMPLMELVFEPDLTNGEEAAALVRELILILTRLNTCQCKMEEGGLRVDANVSVHRDGQPFGVRSEIKNIGSIKGVAKAVDFEINRQCEILEADGSVNNETRMWDPVSEQTLPMRDKEEKQDYRFMPDPNLLPVHLNLSPSIGNRTINVTSLKASIPELPQQTRLRLQNEYSLPLSSTILLVNDDKLLHLFEGIMKEKKSRNSVTVANILCIEILTLVNKQAATLEDKWMTSSILGEVVDLLEERKINLVTLRDVLQELSLGSPYRPFQIVEMKDWFQITDPDKINKLCDDAIRQNPDVVQKYLAGKNKLLFALLGYISQTTHNRADMKLVTEQLQKLLHKCSD